MKNVLRPLQRKSTAVVYIITILLCYGTLFTCYGLNIDSEKIFSGSSFLIEQGRIGSLLISKLLNSVVVIPGWTVIISMLLMTGGVLVWSYIWEMQNSEIDSQAIMIFMCLTVSFPLLSKNLIFFGLRSFFGYIIIASGILTYLFLSMYKSRNLKHYLLYIVLCAFVMSFDKSYIVIHGQGILMFLLLKKYENPKFEINYKKAALYFGSGVLCGYGIMKFTVKIAQYACGVSESSYVNQYITYDFTNIHTFFSSVTAFLKRIIFIIMDIFKGQKTIGIVMIFVLTIWLLAWAAYQCVKNRQMSYLLLSLGMIAMTFSVYIITGNLDMPYRSVSYAFSMYYGCIMMLFYVVIIKNARKKLIYKFFLLLTAVTVFYSSREMSQNFFTAHQSYEDTLIRTKMLMKDVEAINRNYNEKPILFMGVQELGDDEVERGSQLWWDTRQSIKDEESDERIYAFLEMLGYEINTDTEQIDKYRVREMLGDMNSWPAENSIVETEDYILVKLGDSHIEILDRNEILKEYVENPEIMYSIDGFSYDDNNLNMTGWVVLKETPSYNATQTIILSSDEHSYKILAYRINRPDVTEYLQTMGLGEKNYNNSGFYCSESLNYYVEKGTYQIKILLTVGENKYITDTNQKIQID